MLIQHRRYPEPVAETRITDDHTDMTFVPQTTFASAQHWISFKLIQKVPALHCTYCLKFACKIDIWLDGTFAGS